MGRVIAAPSPGVFGRGGCGHGLEPVLAHIADAVDNPLDVALGTAGDIAEHRRVVRSHDGPQIREARELHAQVGAWPVGPVLLQATPVLATDIHPQQLAGHAMKAGGINNHVEFVQGATGCDSGGSDLRDRRFAQINQADIVTVEGLVVILLARTALGAEGVLRDQLFGQHRIGDAFANLVGQELGDLIRGLLRHK